MKSFEGAREGSGLGPRGPGTKGVMAVEFRFKPRACNQVIPPKAICSLLLHHRIRVLYCLSMKWEDEEQRDVTESERL